MTLLGSNLHKVERREEIAWEDIWVKCNEIRTVDFTLWLLGGGVVEMRFCVFCIHDISTGILEDLESRGIICSQTSEHEKHPTSV